jgi:iron complex transport system substrate-binding protein
VAARVVSGDVAEVGWAGNYDLETILALAPDLVLTNSAPGTDVAGAQDGELVSRLAGMGIRCFGVGDWLEATPLGRAGWIVPIAELCGLAEEGEARFVQIESAYNELAARAAEFTATHAHRPEVMLNAPYRDVWYAPGDDSYMIRLIRDAGGEWVCRGTAGTQSRPIDIEQAYVAMGRAEVWLNTNHYSTMAELLADNPRFAATPPVVAGRVYNNNARMTAAGGSDFWESAVVRPDVVLRDLITILHPEALSPAEALSATGSLPDAGDAGNTLYYYKKLE